MKLMSLLSGNGFVMFNKELAHEVSVNASIIFGQLCSSYESFRSKNMLTVRDGKEYFFLTSETLEKETALSYKLQLKATKELADADYIQTKLMGVPSKKFFHITDKIRQDLLSTPSSSKREDLSTATTQGNSALNSDSSYSQREHLGMTNGNGKLLQMGSTIKKKNKKEKDNNKNDNFNCNFKEPVTSDLFKKLMTERCNDLYNQFAAGRWTKQQWNIIVEKLVSDTIDSNRYLDVPIDKITGYTFKCFERIAYNSDYKSSNEFDDYKKVMIELTSENHSKQDFSGVLYNWLEE